MTTTTVRFRFDNTRGYSAADLAVLNDRFVAACAAEGIDLEDPARDPYDTYDAEEHLAERVLVEFDNQQEGWPWK